MTWTQNYDPLGFWPLSTLVSALPVLTLFFVLVVLRKKVWISALSGMLMAFLLAAVVFQMPISLIGYSSLLGFVFGVLRIAWIIVASIFLYNVTVETGQFQVMKDSIANLSADKRIQVVLIAFCFGAFLEGTGGGGAPVAIAGSFLIGLGFPPFQAATVCLVANTAPVAWGAVGNPIRTLVGVTGLPDFELSAMVGRILPPFSLILPLWLVRSTVNWRHTLQVLPALIVAGLSFAAMQFYWSNYQESGLVDIIAAIFSLLVMVAFLKVWRPKEILEIGEQTQVRRQIAQHNVWQVFKGWSPFIIASILIFVFGLPSFNKHLKFDLLTFPLTGIHNKVLRVPPVVPQPTPEGAIMDLNALALPGTAVFAGAFLAMPFLGMSFRRGIVLLGQTFRQLIPSLLAISFMVGLAFVTRYSGMDTVLGLSMTHTGWVYPFFGTLLGWLGVALTGTDAGSNALFGNLQKVTAEQLGLSPILMASANSAGGVMGKMIDAQSIVVSSTATQQVGKEAEIFKAVFKHSIVLAALVGLLVMVYAYVIPWVVPAIPSAQSVVACIRF
ncbi:MAG: L-lactate permease [Acidobacteriota bacterium]